MSLMTAKCPSVQEIVNEERTDRSQAGGIRKYE